MNNLSRRQFLGKSAIGLGSALVASQFPIDLNASSLPGTVKIPIGFQVWTVKDMLVKDFPGTLKKMAELGYQSCEMCSPPGYEGAGFAPLMKLTAKEMKQIIDDAGLSCVSSHYGLGELRDNLDKTVEFAVESGRTQMVLASFWLKKDASLSDWQKSAEELNKIGEKTKKAGIQMVFHNHHGEFEKIDGTLIYDTLLDHLEPEYVKMQFQVAVINIGYKASTYFTKYPGRFISAHLADWSSAENKQVPIGQGIVDWKEFFDTAKTGGVKNIFVEMEMETFKESAAYLKSL
jgi:sugar phosphate isomerase/epimerase